jgi:predicted ATP-dependent protease
MSRTNRIQNSTKIAFALLAVIAGIGYLSYQLYITTIQQEQSIETLQNEISSRIHAINNLTSSISDLKAELEAKQSAIDQLAQRLGLAQSEIESLTPVVKRYYGLAVRQDGTGVVTPIEVKMTKGTGLVSVNIKNVELLGATQESIRNAVFIAGALTTIDVSKKDFDVTFIYESSGLVSIDGPSAGAAITTLVVAALENKTLDSSVLVTGTIEQGGRIGKVGGVLGKAIAARDFGATTFLVPVNESVNVQGLSIREVSSIEEVTNVVLR